MSKFSSSMVKPILESMYESRREMVPCFIGAPGIGKTQGLYQFAKEKGVNVVTFILSNTVPSEVSGIRMPDKDTKKMEVFDDLRMASLKDGDILFFDEILEASPMLWSACLTLIQDRLLASGRKLPDVFIVAASNEVASPGIIPASTRDRFQFIELTFDPNNWCDYMQDKYGLNRVPLQSLASRIEEDSNNYNILTPRTVEKLYLYLANGEHSGDKWKIKKNVIRFMYDATVTSYLVKLIVGKYNTAQQQICYAINTAGISLDCTSEFEELSLKEMLDTLKSLPQWPEIEKVLAQVEYQSVDDNIEY